MDRNPRSSSRSRPHPVKVKSLDAQEPHATSRNKRTILNEAPYSTVFQAVGPSDNNPFIVLWQVFDHARDGDAAWGFGMHDSRGEAPRLKHSAGECDSVQSCLKGLLSDSPSDRNTPSK